uniref:ApeI family dehydratase n=1 Tax=Cellvibrio fontiphilus TaxID=1815559 RepID=UPI002B4BCDAB|nr:hypothetical protein [Cellvibrio fontiphilus]
MSDTTLLSKLHTHFATAEWPRFDGITTQQHQCMLDLYIAPQITWLTGHFPQQPVVAGVVQTHWAGELAKFLFAVGDEFIRIDNLKFQQVILPQQQLQLTLDYSETDAHSVIKFRYSQGDIIYSEGKLIFHRLLTSAQ